MKLTSEKNGYKIEYDTDTKTYIVYDAEGDVVRETTSEEVLEKFLSGEEQRIKDKKEKKKAFEKIKVFRSYLDRDISGIVTSVAEENYSGQSMNVWFTRDDNKQRGKEYASDLYVDTPENRIIQERIIAINKQIKDLQEQIKREKELMVTVESILSVEE